MPVTVNWISGEIFVPRDELPVIQATPELRALNVDDFRFTLNDLEASTEGIPWPDTHVHQPDRTLSGITYAPIVEIIPPYFITFEDGQYGVVLSGANNNVADVKTSNQVSLVSNNSAGLIEVNTGTGLSASEQLMLSTLLMRSTEIWKLLGLDKLDGVEITPSGAVSDSGDIDVVFTGDGVNLTRMVRQP